MVPMILKDVVSPIRRCFQYVEERVLAPFPPMLKVLNCGTRNLKPGGWVEFQELLPRAHCNDGTMPPDYAVSRFFEAMVGAAREKMGWNLFALETIPVELERIGFTNIQHKVYHVPLGVWPKDPKRRQHAALYRETVLELVDPLLSKLLVDGAPGITRTELEDLIPEVKRALSARDVHAYVHLHFLWAQKPKP
jgi:hypothetical protein